MTRAELAHVIRAVCSVLRVQEVWVVGSQSILATFSEEELPIPLTVSTEADLFVPDWSQKDENEVEATLGEVSKFAETYGYYADPVSMETVRAPAEWETRVIPFYNELTNGCTAWCLEVHDLAISKMAAARYKDKLFVTMLLENGLVHESILRERLKAAHNFSEQLNQTIETGLNRIIQSIRGGPPTEGNS